MLSKKQQMILAFPYTKYDALICDGAIRSGKTSIMIVAFVDWAMKNFNNQRFGICGKTVDSATKNIVLPYISMKYVKDRYAINFRRSGKTLEVHCGEVFNIFEIFGGKDEASAALIQGRTLAGVLLDEVVLMPKSFVEQAMARCSVEGAKMWFSCNPGSPSHWFYEEWVLEAKRKNALYLHFEMRDNPSLSEKTLARYDRMYTGVFYQRFILGLWVLAEGLVYDFFDKDVHTTEEIPQTGEFFISIDYGTMNPFSAGLWCVNGSKAIRIREYYYDGRKALKQQTDEEYCDQIERLAKTLEYEDPETGELVCPPISRVVVDPSATSFITALRRRGFKVVHADNDVINGIRRTAVYLKNGNILIHKSCKDAIREFGLYSWDEKGSVDNVVKENDHAMDDIRYFCNTIMKKRVRNADEKTPVTIWS